MLAGHTVAFPQSRVAPISSVYWLPQGSLSIDDAV